MSVNIRDSLTEKSSAPIYLSKVEVNGGESFSDEFFKKLLNPILSTSDYTLGKLLETTEKTKENIEKTGVFHSVAISIKEDPSLLPGDVKLYTHETPVSTKLVYDLKPINLNKYDSYLSVNNDHLNINLNYLNNNFNSNSECLQVGVNYDPYSPNLVSNVKITSPLHDASIRSFLDIVNLNVNADFQKSKNHTTGGVVGLQLYSKLGSFLTTSSVGISILKRNIYSFGENVSDLIRKDAGVSNKVSIVNKFALSSLIHKSYFPVEGSLINFDNELSNASDLTNTTFKFFKTTLSSDLYQSFWNEKFTINLNSSVGSIIALDNSNTANLHVNDKFYLGGASNFRGYDVNSIGLKDNEEYIGGHSFFKLGGTLYSKLPQAFFPKLTDESPIRLYVTGNVGDVLSEHTSFSKVTSNLLKGNFNDYAVNYGFGVKYFNPRANFDISYVLTNNRVQDTVKAGVQFSVSIGGANY